MPSFNDMLNNMNQSYAFYIRGVMNSVTPEFMTDRTLTEENTSGEMLEALRLIALDKFPDFADGQVEQFTYDDVRKYFDEKSIFDTGFTIDTIGKQIRTVLGNYTVRRDGGNFIVTDYYDFKPETDGGFFSTASKAVKGFASSENMSEGIYTAARTMGGYIMPEGDNNQPLEDTMKINFTIPVSEPRVVATLFEEEPEPEATEHVFRGPMTPQRYSLWKTFSGQG